MRADVTGVGPVTIMTRAEGWWVWCDGSDGSIGVQILVAQVKSNGKVEWRRIMAIGRLLLSAID